MFSRKKNRFPVFWRRIGHVPNFSGQYSKMGKNNKQLSNCLHIIWALFCTFFAPTLTGYRMAQNCSFWKWKYFPETWINFGTRDTRNKHNIWKSWNASHFPKKWFFGNIHGHVLKHKKSILALQTKNSKSAPGGQNFCWKLLSYP